MTDRCVAPQYSFSQGNTIFGLTSTTGSSVIKYIGFSKDTTLPTDVSAPVIPHANPQDGTYNLMGQKLTSPLIAPNGIVIHSGKKLLIRP